MRTTITALLVIVGLALPLLAQPANPATDAIPFAPDKLVAVQREFPEAISRYQQQVLPLLSRGDYAKLELLAQDLRTSKKQLSSGAWELAAFYGACSELPENATAIHWQRRQVQLETWARKNTNSITALVALADFWTSYALLARGEDWVASVSPQNLNLMKARMTRAGDIVKLAVKLEPKCPYFYAVVQTIALHSGMPRPQYEQMLAEGIALAPGFMSFYYQKIMFLQPRWHGKSADEWHVFVKAEADKIGADDGDLFYARCACFVSSFGYYDAFIRDSPVDWPRLRHGLEVCLQRYPDSLWAQTRLCYFSGQKGEKQQMQKYFLKIGQKVDTSVWSKARFLEDREWAFKP
jgi:hypothetical protein